MIFVIKQIISAWNLLTRSSSSTEPKLVNISEGFAVVDVVDVVVVVSPTAV